MNTSSSSSVGAVLRRDDARRHAWGSSLSPRDVADHRAVLVSGDRLLADAAGHVVIVDVRDVDAAHTPDAFVYLGEDDQSALFVAPVAAANVDELEVVFGASFRSLREIAPLLSEADAELAVTAVAMARFVRDSRFCGRCGAEAVLTKGGWSRTCPNCAYEFFPRSDPAVIVAVTKEDQLLLGSNAAWPAGRFSCFAGFTEAGESAEQAVAREVWEESGVRTTNARYVGSQSWPYPHSLMLGFVAETASVSEQADGEEIVEVRWFTRAEIRSSLAGEGPVSLPGPSSIAYRLISGWVNEEAL